MHSRRHVVTLWLAIGILAAAIGAVLWSPMRVAWRCYQLHRAAPRAEAELVAKLGGGSLALRLRGGGQAGSVCTAETSGAHWEASQPGDVLEVVTRPGRPGECVLVASIENSGIVLWSITGGVASVGLLLLSLGLLVQRSFTRPGAPALPQR